MLPPSEASAFLRARYREERGLSVVGKGSGEWWIRWYAAHRRKKEVFVTEGGMPPAERPSGGREGDEQAKHLREDAGQEAEGLREDVGQAERLRDDAGLSKNRSEQEEADEGLLDKATDKLTGQ